MSRPDLDKFDIHQASDINSDYQYFPIDAGMDSIIAAPDAAIRVQGAVGVTLVANGVDFTGAPDNWTAVTATLTAAGSGQAGNCLSVAEDGGVSVAKAYQDITTVIGKLYRLIYYFKKGTSANGKVMVGITTDEDSIYDSGNLADAAWALYTVYFRATATTTRLTCQSNSVTAGQTSFFDTISLLEFTRPAIVREFSNSVQQCLVIDWLPPADWDVGTIKFTPYWVITQTAPADGKTVIMQMCGMAIGDSDSLSQATGTAQTSTLTAASHALYDMAKGAESAAITVGNTPAAGKKVRLIIDRLIGAGTDYAQKIGLTGISVKFTRRLTP